ncbi:hypothetical protein LCGC14_0912690 [marine sediment metagenome]|uniref:Uncharacterized protein n=1 Tax=marine sediment metagenome TaxID=412755 RepID=A0A0F9RC10_9ZZZZ
MCGPKPSIYKKAIFKMKYDWEYACITCNGNGKEEKNSAGCTGYKMQRTCISCDGEGSVDLLTHNIQVNKQKRFFECTKDFTKNKQDFLG